MEGNLSPEAQSSGRSAALAISGGASSAFHVALVGCSLLLAPVAFWLL
jgi:hypothetical protein